jgi:hypothetical protein
LWVSAKGTRRRSTSSINLIASVAEIASGLSQITGVFWSRKARLAGTCVLFGVTIVTHSMLSARRASAAAMALKSA